MEKGYIGHKKLKAYTHFLKKNTNHDYLIVGNGCIIGLESDCCVMVKTESIPEDAPLVIIPGDFIRNAIVNKEKRGILIYFDELKVSDLTAKIDISKSVAKYSNLRSLLFPKTADQPKQKYFMNVNTKHLEKIAKFTKAFGLGSEVTLKLLNTSNILVMWGGFTEVAMLITQHNMFALKDKQCDLFVSELVANFPE